MTARRRGGRVRRRSRLAMLAPVAAMALALGPVIATLQSQPAAADTTFSTNPVQVTISRLTPIAPQPGDTLVIAGTLHNTSSTSAVGDLHYTLKMGSAGVISRDTFDAYADNQDGDLTGLGATPVSAISTANPATLAPNASEPYKISVPVDSLGLDPNTPQVRELGVSVTSGFTVVGHLRTFLPWSPHGASSAGAPIGVAWIWPLVDRPHRTTAAAWYDDALAAEISNTGRLGGLLNAAAAAQTQHSVGKHPAGQQSPVPVTWAIDPMLVSDVKAMTTAYQVTGSAGTTAGPGGAAAKSWLAALTGAVTRPAASVLPLPYGDPDVVAAVRAGFSTTVGLAAAGGRNILAQLLPGAPLLSTVAWPPGGLADDRSINELVASGDQTVVLADSALPPILAQNATPPAHTTLTTGGGSVDTVLTDSGLSTAISDGPSNPDGPRVSLQRFLAETLMIHEEAPFPPQPRNLVLAPNRRWVPTAAYAGALLADTGKVPWIRPLSLSQVTGTAADTNVARRPLTYPDSARHNELSGSYLHQVGSLRSDIANFSAILPQGNATIRGYNIAVWEALSSAWRQQHALANSTLDSLTSQVGSQMNQVRITSLSGSFVTLTSHGGKVPITISNNLSTPVNVVLRIAANQRLTRNSSRVVPLPAHQQTVVDMHADAKTSGVFQLTARLLTPKGKVYGPPVKIYVRSTAYGTITLVITGGATAALLVAVAIRLTRRARAARRASAAANP